MRYLLATLGFILLVIVIVVLLVSPGPQKATTKDNQVIKLLSYSDNQQALVRYTIAGPISGSEDYRAVQISVSPTSRSLDVLKGYQGEVVASQTYANDPQAYSKFLNALKQVNFTAERKVGSDVSAVSVCPLGNRTHYQIVDNNKTVMDLWSASCQGGSFAGQVSATRSLFRLQIPDYGKLTTSVNVTGQVSRTIF